MSSTDPGSAWTSRITAATDSYVYPLPPSNTSTGALRKRRHYIYPREDSGIYMPSGPAEPTGNPSGRPTSNYRPQARSNPFEDPQYEYGATISERRPMHEWEAVLEDQRSDPSASAAKWKYGKACRGRLRNRIRAVFTSSKKATSKHQQPEAGSSLLKGQGAHFGRGTMRGQRCTDCQRETEARSLVA